MGPSLSRLINEQAYPLFDKLFSIVAPGNISFDPFEIAYDRGSTVYLLKSRIGNLQLRGTFEKLDDPPFFLFIGSPWITSIEELGALDLFLSDFARHDAMADLLLALQLQTQVSLDSQKLRMLNSEKTEQLRQAYSRILESETTLRLLLDSTHDIGIYMTDSAGHVTSWNKGASKITGLQSSEILGMNIHDILPVSLSELRQKIQTGANRFETTFEFQHVMHKQVKINIIIHPILNSEGNCRGYCHNIRDITEVEQLRVISTAIEQARALSSLTGNLAHQINNLLANIIVELDNLLEKEESQGANHTEAINRVIDLFSKIGHISDNLIAFSGQQILKNQNADLNNLIKTTLASIPVDADENFNFELELCDQNLDIYIDTDGFKTSLNHLVRNAVEAMSDSGTGKIRIRTFIPNSLQLEQENISKDSMYCVVVEDSGHGIDDSILPRVFEPFFTTRDSSTNGKGMGLSYVQGFLRQIGGEIRIHSDKQVGTSVYVFLPCKT